MSANETSFGTDGLSGALWKRRRLGSSWGLAGCLHCREMHKPRVHESDERNRWGGMQQGFEALFLGFLCIGKFLKSKQKE